MSSKGKYVHLDSDESRLPDAMERVGYDADTQTYTYRDATDGSYWEGEEGNRYGELHRVSAPAQSQPLLSTEDDEAPPPYQPRTYHASHLDGPARHVRYYDDWRYMAPFMVLVIVVLLSLFRFLDSASAPPALPSCPGEGLEPYRLVAGDTCWAIAEGRGSTVEALKVANPGLKCENLRLGEGICIPMPGSSASAGKGEGGGELGGPRPQCYMITCNKQSGGDEACHAEGCGKGCSEGGKCVS